MNVPSEATREALARVIRAPDSDVGECQVLGCFLALDLENRYAMPIDSV